MQEHFGYLFGILLSSDATLAQEDPAQDPDDSRLDALAGLLGSILDTEGGAKGHAAMLLALEAATQEIFSGE